MSNIFERISCYDDVVEERDNYHLENMHKQKKIEDLIKQEKIYKNQVTSLEEKANKYQKLFEKEKEERIKTARSNGGLKTSNNYLKSKKKQNAKFILEQIKFIKDLTKHNKNLTKENLKLIEEKDILQNTIIKLQNDVEKYKNLKDLHAVEKYDTNHKTSSNRRKRKK